MGGKNELRAVGIGGSILHHFNEVLRQQRMHTRFDPIND